MKPGDKVILKKDIKGQCLFKLFLSGSKGTIKDPQIEPPPGISDSRLIVVMETGPEILVEPEDLELAK